MALDLPSGDLTFQFCLLSRTTIQTLAPLDREFDLGHIEPGFRAWAYIHREHLFYLVDKLGIALGWNTPLLFELRLEFLF